MKQKKVLKYTGFHDVTREELTQLFEAGSITYDQAIEDILEGGCGKNQWSVLKFFGEQMITDGHIVPLFIAKGWITHLEPGQETIILTASHYLQGRTNPNTTAKMLLSEQIGKTEVMIMAQARRLSNSRQQTLRFGINPKQLHFLGTKLNPETAFLWQFAADIKPKLKKKIDKQAMDKMLKPYSLKFAGKNKYWPIVPA